MTGIVLTVLTVALIATVVIGYIAFRRVWDDIDALMIALQLKTRNPDEQEKP